MSVLGMSVVVKSSDHYAAVRRFSRLLEAGTLDEFELPGGELTVTVLPGLSILSGKEQALSAVGALLATVFVDSLEKTRGQLVDAGWTIDGSLGAPRSLLARDVDGSLFEFVEQFDG